MHLLKEVHQELQLIEEGEDNKKFYLEGICMQSNLKNKNGRIYPKEILANEVANYIRDKIDNKTAYGELGHPDTPNINLDRISHRFISLREAGNDFVCKALLSENPMGQIARNLLKEGGRLGISSRALGSLTERNGTKYVGEDLKLITAGDLVTDPSAPEAWMNAVYERKEWCFVPGKGWMEQYLDEGRQEIIKASANDLEAVAFNLFETFINRL